MAMQTGLEGKPWWYGLAIGAAVAALVLGLVWWRLIDPMNEELTAKEAQLEELQQKIVEGRAAKAQLPRFREQVRTLQLELDKLLRILPSRRNTSVLLRQVRALAEQGDFGFHTFTPGGFVEREFYSEWPIRINLTGDYHGLARFFDQVSRLSRIINVEDLLITARPSGEETIAATFTAKTFVYKESEDDETTDAPAAATGG
ncbi:MAG TPA: type 4a pilus biogenesis protein PilO [Solirubrobacterales bacterium]|nr:type 4a pilus biogenesis protein PilO [Solirubrobacterales bacterium]